MLKINTDWICPKTGSKSSQKIGYVLLQKQKSLDVRGQGALVTTNLPKMRWK
jgi:hypothetical protein